MARFVARLGGTCELPERKRKRRRCNPRRFSAPPYRRGTSLGRRSGPGRQNRRERRICAQQRGGSPHMAIMGGVGSGKTRTAVHILKALRRFGSVPLLAFDFKGDLAEGLSAAYTADVLHPPEESIPLDVLHVGSNADTAIKTAAARIRDSIASVKSRRPSGVQSEALREAVTATLRTGATGGTIALADVARALAIEYEERGRGPDELTSTLNELTQFNLFVPDRSPRRFLFKKLDHPVAAGQFGGNATADHQSDAERLGQMLNALPDAPTDDSGVAPCAMSRCSTRHTSYSKPGCRPWPISSA